MALRKQTGNMYSFINFTKNYVKGRCPYSCAYCYMKAFRLKPMRFDKKELNEDMGEGKFIFVGSSFDMYHPEVLSEDILRILAHCNKYPDNEYLFQSKNPERFLEFTSQMPEDVVLGTTIESNYSAFMRNGKQWQASKAPKPSERYEAMTKLKRFTTMVTIEPIMKFDCDTLVSWIKHIAPEWVNIGADSKGHNLPEPPADKIRALIAHLRKFTQVKLKNNLGRLLK